MPSEKTTLLQYILLRMPSEKTTFLQYSPK